MADEDTQAANDAIRAQAAAAVAKREGTPAPQSTAPVTTTATTPPPDATSDDDAELGGSGEKALDAFKQRARAAEKEAKALAAKVKEFEDRDKSEQEKLEERASTAEQRAAQAERQLLRYEVAAAKKLPVELADRLQGETKKELEEDADRLLTLVKPNGKPSGDVDAGKGEGGSANTFNDLLRAKAHA